ncbi:hypothetical protein [Alkalihalobacillus deserti]|uniref:hypothetical protein n=1 Tax=Alkalihalobacillus deserti TaxID=2879466 RepID=UPI001D148A28|nr:hypothetical protein [Alkalihalobacillus deserti]
MKTSRFYPMMSYQKPLKAYLTIEEINGMTFSSSKSKEIDVHESNSLGLSFSTDLDFPMKEETPLTFKIKFFTLGEMTGEITQKEKRYNGGYYYDLKAIACNLQYLKTFATFHETPVDRMSYSLIS